jgi:MFS family permease
MLGPLALSYAEFMCLTGVAFLARVAVLPLLGEVAHKRGTRVVLWWGALGIVPIPALWLLSHDFLYLLALQVVAGCAWAALEYATLLSFFEGIEERDRASVLSAFNLANAAAIALGAVAGSQLFTGLNGSVAGYAWLFAISTAGRLGALWILRGARVAERVPRLHLRTLAVRPSAGAIQRPILASAEDEASEASAPGEPTGAQPHRLQRAIGVGASDPPESLDLPPPDGGRFALRPTGILHVTS